MRASGPKPQNRARPPQWQMVWQRPSIRPLLAVYSNEGSLSAGSALDGDRSADRIAPRGGWRGEVLKLRASAGFLCPLQAQQNAMVLSLIVSRGASRRCCFRCRVIWTPTKLQGA